MKIQKKNKKYKMF